MVLSFYTKEMDMSSIDFRVNGEVCLLCFYCQSTDCGLFLIWQVLISIVVIFILYEIRFFFEQDILLFWTREDFILNNVNFILNNRSLFWMLRIVSVTSKGYF